MATATTNEVDQIRREMAQIRQKLHQDMQGVVAGAEAASDWRYYVRLYPWAALGVAAAVGFLVVPRKRRSVTAAAEKAAEKAVAKVAEVVDPGAIGRVAAAVVPEPEAKEKAKAKKGLIGSAMALAMPLALRAAQSYALNFVESWIAQQQAAAAGQGPQGQGPGPGFPGSMGGSPPGGPRPPGWPPQGV